MSDNTSVDPESVMVSISAVSAGQDTVDRPTDNHNDASTGHDLNSNSGKDQTSTASESASLAPPTLSISSVDTSTHPTTTTTTSAEKAQESANALAALPPKPPTILLPPVDIETGSSDDRRTLHITEQDDSPKENIGPLPGSAASSKQGIAKPKTSASATSKAVKPTNTSSTTLKKPLSTSTGRAAGSTTATSAARVKPAASSLPRTPLTPSSSTVKPRPAIPASLRGTTTSSSTATPTSSSATASTASTARTAAAAGRLLAPSSAAPSIRKSPSTPSLSSSSSSTTGPARNSTSIGRRVASSSGIGAGSSVRTSPSTTPGPTRSPSQASIASTASTATTSRRPLATSASSSTTSLANRVPSSTTLGASSTLASRRTPSGSSSTNPSPNSTVRQPAVGSIGRTATTATRPTAAQATSASASARKTPATSTAASSSTRTTLAVPARPVTDAVKVKMLSTQLNGLQEKHDQTLKLLQEQEERMRRELEELTLVPEPQRKPISSDVQEVLKEMEELRKQFNDAKTQHEKALEDLAAEREQEVSELKVAHEALLLAMKKERDSVAESLKTLQESGELTERERDARIKEMEEQMEVSLKGQADAVLKHAEALESLRVETEAAWTTKHEFKVQELTKLHEEQLKALEDRAVASGSTKDTEIQDLNDSYAQQIKDLEDDQEKRVLEMIAKHEAEIQEWKDKFSNQTEAHEELVTQLKQEHSEAMEKMASELEVVKAARDEAQSELDRTHTDSQEQLEEVRLEMEKIRKLLAAKDAETAELQKRVEELQDELESASMGAMLKNNKKYKVKNVQIYGSSVSGNLKVKRAQQSISDTLEQLEIEYEFVDVSVSDDAKRYMRRKNAGEAQLPQIFSGGEYRGLFDDFEYAIETHQLVQFLGFDRIKGFMPRHKADFNNNNDNNASGDRSPSSLYSSNTLAQDGEDAEQGAGSPTLVVNGLGNRGMPLGLSSGKNGGGKDIGTSMYLLSPASNKFQSNSSLASNTSSRSNSLRPGFVQTASQVWNGALKDDITHAKHDLGFGSNPVLMDDDELDELFEQGAVTEADLQAMLESV